MATSSRIVACKVKEGREIVLDWYAIPTSHENTFASVFETIIQASHAATPGFRFKRPINLKQTCYTKCQILPSASVADGEAIEVGWNLPVTETLNSFSCSHIVFHISQQTPTKVVDAFAELLRAQKGPSLQLKYPENFGQEPVARGDWKFKNEFIKHILEENQFGFASGSENNIGKKIVNGVCDSLYYILPHLDTLSSRSVNLPPLFEKFCESRTDYNDPSSYKHKVKTVDRAKLNDHVQDIFRVLTFPCFGIPRMRDLKVAILSLAQGLSKYVDYLGSQNKRSLDLHNLPHPARSPADGVSTRLKHIPGCLRLPALIDRYRDLEECLMKTDEYVPVSLVDFYPSDRRKRYSYVQDLKLSFDITYYQFSSGGPYEDLYFVWRCSKILDMQMANKVIHEIEKGIKIFHSRAMAREFRERFSLVCKTSNAVLNEMYKQISNDSSAAPCGISAGVRQRLVSLLDSQNEDIVFDMRSLNGGRDTKFDNFFNEVEKFLNELSAVDDRRHGLISHMAVAMSVRDLHQQICSRLPAGTDVPSVEYLRLQFMPKNPSLSTALQYSGRFPLKLRIQSRQFNMFHVDAHYSSALQKYLKSFAVRFREHCVLLSVDDKNHIPVGEPGIAVATVYRSKKAVAHSEIQNISADHDTSSKLKLTPSVAIQIDIPELVNGDFYNGQVCVTLKDTIFQPSNPLRHVAEMRQFLSVTGQLGQPIRLIYSDGGPDHRVTYPSVKMALIAMFLIDDCDYLVAMRTAPHQSYRNWVERIMSILNLGLQTVAISRDKMNDDMENVFKNLGTMNGIRTSCEKNENLKEALKHSLEPVLDILNQLFGRLQLKDKQFMIGQPASEALMEELWDSIQTLDSTVQRSDTQTKQIEKRAKLKSFLDHCTVSRKYYFMIKKCGRPECEICRPSRLPQDVFSKLHAIPDPEPRTDDPSHYKEFSELYGETTSESFCPSMKQMLYISPDGESRPLPNIKMTAETVRDYVKCIDCGKPRCIYSNKRLSSEQKSDVDKMKEDVIFTCGGVLIPHDHPLFDVVIVQPNSTCLTPVAPHYYSQRAGFQAVCFNCGSNENLHEISNDLKQRFQSVHPVCVECKSNDITERTRGAKKMKK